MHDIDLAVLTEADSIYNTCAKNGPYVERNYNVLQCSPVRLKILCGIFP